MIPVVAFKHVFSKTAKRHVRELSTGASSGDKFVPRTTIDVSVSHLSKIFFMFMFRSQKQTTTTRTTTSNTNTNDQSQQEQNMVLTSATTKTIEKHKCTLEDFFAEDDDIPEFYICSTFTDVIFKVPAMLNGRIYEKSEILHWIRKEGTSWLIDWMMKWLIWMIELRKCWCTIFMNEWDRHHHRRRHILLRKLKKQLENGSELTMIAFFI